MTTPINIVLNSLALGSLLLLIFGTIGNLFSIIICLRKTLRSVPTFVFFIFILCNDIVCLYFWNFNHYLRRFNGFVIEDFGITWCRVATSLQFSTLQASAWLLVSMSVERYMSIVIKHWRSRLFSAKRACVVSLIIMFLIFTFNGTLLFTINYERVIHANESISAACYSTKAYITWHKIHIYLYAIIPSLVITLANILLIYKTIYAKKASNVSRSIESCRKRKNMTYSIIAMTFGFIIVTLPSAISGGYFLQYLLATPKGLIVLYVLNGLDFAYHSFNFIVFLALNTKFSREFKIIIKIDKRLLDSSTFSSIS